MARTRQSSLGERQVHRKPDYSKTKIGRVTSIADYKKYGRIEVVFLDHGYPFPVWVTGNLDREPVTGDQVVIGYMEGRKDAPYLVSFVRNESYTSNFVEVSKDRVRLQLPMFELDQKNGAAHKDVQEHLLNEQKAPQRLIVDLNAKEQYIMMQFPMSANGSIPPAYFKLDKAGGELFHPEGNFTIKLPKGALDVIK